MVTFVAQRLSTVKTNIVAGPGCGTRRTRGHRSPQYSPAASNTQSAPSDRCLCVHLFRSGTMPRAIHVNAAAAADGSDVNNPNGNGNKVAHSVENSHQGHAFLHDFCMAIPYGIGVALAGTVALCLRQFSLAFALICSAAAIEYIAALSIKRWKQAGSSTSLTTATAAIAAAVTAMLWRQTPQQTWAVLTLRGVSALSALLLLFFVYNIAAGGNPPKEDKPAADVSTTVTS